MNKATKCEQEDKERVHLITNFCSADEGTPAMHIKEHVVNHIQNESTECCSASNIQQDPIIHVIAPLNFCDDKLDYRIKTENKEHKELPSITHFKEPDNENDKLEQFTNKNGGNTVVGYDGTYTEIGDKSKLQITIKDTCSLSTGTHNVEKESWNLPHETVDIDGLESKRESLGSVELNNNVLSETDSLVMEHSYNCEVIHESKARRTSKRLENKRKNNKSDNHDSGKVCSSCESEFSHPFTSVNPTCSRKVKKKHKQTYQANIDSGSETMNPIHSQYIKVKNCVNVLKTDRLCTNNAQCKTEQHSFETETREVSHTPDNEDCNFFHCDICGKRYSKEKYLARHIKRQHTDKHTRLVKCDVCFATFSRKDVLDRHKILHQTEDEYPYLCDQCGSKHHNLDILFNHVKKMHSKNVNSLKNLHSKELKKNYHYQCKYCNKVYRCSVTIQKHIRLHLGIEGPYKCHDCGQRFQLKKILKKHLMRAHSKSRPYKCSGCQKCYKTKPDLSAHMKRH